MKILIDAGHGEGKNTIVVHYISMKGITITSIV